MPPIVALRCVLPPLSHPALGDTVRRHAIGRSPREKYRLPSDLVARLGDRSRARRGLKTRRVVRRASTSRGNTRRDDHVAPSTRVHPSDRTRTLTPRPAFRPLLQKQFQNKTKDHVRARYERHGQGRRRPQGDRVQAPRLRLHGPPRRPQGPRRRYVPPLSQHMPKTMMKKKQMNLVPLLRNHHHHSQISIDLLFPEANRNNNTSPPNQSIPRSPQGPCPGHRQGCLPDRGPEQETQRSHLHRL